MKNLARAAVILTTFLLLLAGAQAEPAHADATRVGVPQAYATVDVDRVQPAQVVQPAQDEVREPLLGACVRPLVGEGGVLNLPLLDIPGKRIPNDSIELTVGGEYSDCKMGGIGV